MYPLVFLRLLERRLITRCQIRCTGHSFVSVLVSICSRFYSFCAFAVNTQRYTSIPGQLGPEQLFDTGSRRTNGSECPVVGARAVPKRRFAFSFRFRCKRFHNRLNVILHKNGVSFKTKAQRKRSIRPGKTSFCHNPVAYPTVFGPLSAQLSKFQGAGPAEVD